MNRTPDLAPCVSNHLLSEDPAVRVGVLEAGQYVPDDPTINVPGYFGRSIGNPALDWGFLTVPQKHANGRLIYHPRWVGKSRMSGRTDFVRLGERCWEDRRRGSEAEYDALEALGNPGWNFSSFQHYFSKSETTNPLPEDVAQTYGAQVVAPAGTDGPIARSYPGWFSDLHLPLFDAYKALGVDVNVDPNGGKNTGVTTVSCAITPGKSTRSYSVTGYWEPYADRPNLVLVTGARATK
ncbi:hypothetical protein FRC08_004736, partial [Ceratobasidium sp. 394]